MTTVRTTFQVPQLLLHRLKVQAAKEQTDVSRLLCKIAEEYLAQHENKPFLTRKDGRVLLADMRASMTESSKRSLANSYGGKIKTKGPRA